MSQTLFVEYQNNGFWAYDVAVGIFLKYMIDYANEYATQEDKKWLSECIDSWRVNAVVSDYGLHFNDDWSEYQIQIIIRLIDEVCIELEQQESISAQQIESWNILDGKGVFSRGAAQFSTAPIVEMSRAIKSLINGTLQEAPKGFRWLYGSETGRTTVKKRT